MQERHVIGRGKDIVVGEPDRPKAASKPAVAFETVEWMFARNIKVDDTNQAAFFEHRHGVFDRGEPIGNHRQRIGERDDIDLAFRRPKRRRIGLDRLDVVPIVLFDSSVCDFEQRM